MAFSRHTSSTGAVLDSPPADRPPPQPDRRLRGRGRLGHDLRRYDSDRASDGRDQPDHRGAPGDHHDRGRRQGPVEGRCHQGRARLPVLRPPHEGGRRLNPALIRATLVRVKGSASASRSGRIGPRPGVAVGRPRSPSPPQGLLAGWPALERLPLGSSALDPRPSAVPARCRGLGPRRRERPRRMPPARRPHLRGPWSSNRCR
jgi:hypothetical protein